MKNKEKNSLLKPDFLDLDGDGNKEESMKKASEDKEEMREPKAEGGEMEMLPDEQMEEQFVDFVIDEALSDKEESMLMEQLEANPELSMIFDKVVEKASEFTGAGEVEGPGTGVSDSIPARLSDGEFVFTAKATEEIGADELMRMMKDAEANADKRQQVAVGGMLDSGEEEIDSNVNRQQVTNEGTYIPEEDTTVRDKIRETMLDPSAQSRYVRS